MVQGPPGTGKTWTGARLAVDLLERDLRVGIAATSHKAINNMLAAIDEAADEAGVTFRGWKKSRRPGGRVRQRSGHEQEVPAVGGRRADPADRGDGLALGGGGRARQRRRAVRRRGRADVARRRRSRYRQCAKSVVLLGDPQQLAHVSQGTHPLASGVSVLEHLLGDLDTMPPDRGVFLDTSWRMHPDDLRLRLEHDVRLAPGLGRRPRAPARRLTGACAEAGCACWASTTSTTAVARPRRPTRSRITSSSC